MGPIQFGYTLSPSNEEINMRFWEKYGISSAASIWFEIWGSWIRVKKCRFSRKMFQKFRFFQVISQRNSIFQGKFPTNCDFLCNFRKIDFPGKNWLFTAIFGQIILFLFKSHHFLTYFLYTLHDKI